MRFSVATLPVETDAISRADESENRNEISERGIDVTAGRRHGGRLYYDGNRDWIHAVRCERGQLQLEEFRWGLWDHRRNAGGRQDIQRTVLSDHQRHDSR